RILPLRSAPRGRRPIARGAGAARAARRIFVRRLTATALIAAMTALTATLPAAAQRSEDTLRIALSDGVPILDHYLDVRPEMSFLRDAVFDSLLAYDFQNKTFKPLLATSWTQVDDVTLEMDLRDDITWHDGEAFDADDVVYTLTYLSDPDVPLRA